MSIFTAQERRVIYILIGILVVGSVVYFYKLRNPYFAPELDKAVLEMSYEDKGIDSLIKLSTSQVGIKKHEINNKGKNPSTSKVNINTASKEKLMQLPGIGPVYAERIIDYRTENGRFNNLAEIRNIKGIGEKKFENLKDKIEID